MGMYVISFLSGSVVDSWMETQARRRETFNSLKLIALLIPVVHLIVLEFMGHLVPPDGYVTCIL
jgi:hypothetical protein